MAKYRNVHVKMWIDRDYMKLGKDAKLLFLYLITNPYINNSGIYELPIKTISTDTSIPCPIIEQLLVNQSIKNIFYDLENEVVYVSNIRKYNKTGNPVQVEKGIISEFGENSGTFLWKMFVELNPQFKGKLSIIDQSLPNDSLPLPLPLPLCLDSKDLTNNKPLKIGVEKWFEEDWRDYLKGGDKQRAKSGYFKSVTTLEKRQDFQEKTRAYIASVNDPTYLKNGDTWFCGWQKYDIKKTKPSKSKSEIEIENLANLVRKAESNENDTKRIGNGLGIT